MESKNSYIDEIEEMIKSDGLTVLDTKNGIINMDDRFLKMPKDITSISPDTLSQMLYTYTQQMMYANTLLARTKLLIKESELDYKTKGASLYAELSEKKMSEKAKENIIVTNDEVRPIYEKHIKYILKKDYLENLLTSLENAKFALSRELSRRLSEYNAENKASRYHT